MMRKAIELSKIESREQQAIKALEEKAVDKVEENREEDNKQQPQGLKAKQPLSKLQPLKGTTTNNKTSQLG